MLDAQFVQRCEVDTRPTLTGRVKYQAYPLCYGYVSDAGDFIGQGTSNTYGNATSVFSLGDDGAGDLHGLGRAG